MAEETTNPVETGQETVSQGAASQETGGEATGATETQAPSFHLETFNKTFETSYEDEGSLKTALQSMAENENLRTELQQANEKASKYDQVLEYYKPENLYGDDETYAFIEMRKKFPERDLGLVSAIRSPEFENMSDLQKLILADKLKVSGNVPDSVRKEGILDRLGIDSDDVSEWTEKDRYKVAAALSDNMAALKEIREFKPEPRTFDLAGEKEAYEKRMADNRSILEHKVKPFAESIIKNYKGPKAYSKGEDGNFTEAFSYEVDSKEKAQYTENLVNAMVNANMEPTKENIQQAMAYVDNHFKVLNFDKIVTAALKHGQSLAAEEAHKQMHTDQDPNKKEAPNIGESQGQTLKERVRAGWNKEQKK